MSRGLQIFLITIGGLITIGTIMAVFIKIMINITKYVNEKNGSY
ncbi:MULTISPECIES: hypothetical protein [Clostridium]|uniref:Uncharacterized protein n=1 Tax=Clostridium ljungdahlii (strain ATCC 55383 / DSM 13528 / PETC) TaxID=748727 RepID=A0ABX2TQT1_CLOLD|nr:MULTISPECIES: hypothetical protein [Clostridium]ALU36234.1 Hypothetical protein CLAU_1805 [Clostridium autoethanogenum DSM 10061]OAA85203.1 hypothetical protein WX45_00707 [Clostridium ljungdahlii DSM 13528]OVY48795.1 hypothetical protein WX72_00184 [Clostridium autoethanogenum]